MKKEEIFIIQIKPGDELAFTTLKGKALLAAIDAGMIRKKKKSYNVAPFLKFWEIFQPEIKNAVEEMKNAVEDTYQVWQSTQKKVGGDSTDQCADCSDNHLSEE